MLFKINVYVVIADFNILLSLYLLVDIFIEYEM